MQEIITHTHATKIAQMRAHTISASDLQEPSHVTVAAPLAHPPPSWPLPAQQKPLLGNWFVCLLSSFPCFHSTWTHKQNIVFKSTLKHHLNGTM